MCSPHEYLMLELDRLRRKWLKQAAQHRGCQSEAEDLEGRDDEYWLHKVEADCLEASARELAETLNRMEI